MAKVSKKQLKANRQNAKFGGVKTERGKAISKYNALKHGLLSQEVLLAGDDKRAFSELRKRIYRDLRPTDEIELLITDRIVANMWRLKRLLKVEAAAMEWRRQRELHEVPHLSASEEQIEREATKEMIVNKDTKNLLRYETAIERSIYRALHELQRLQSAKSSDDKIAPVAVDIDVSKN